MVLRRLGPLKRQKILILSTLNYSVYWLRYHPTFLEHNRNGKEMPMCKVTTQGKCYLDTIIDLFWFWLNVHSCFLFSFMKCVLATVAPPVCSSQELQWQTGSSYEELENMYQYHCNANVSIEFSVFWSLTYCTSTSTSVFSFLQRLLLCLLDTLQVNWCYHSLLLKILFLI